MEGPLDFYKQKENKIAHQVIYIEFEVYRVAIGLLQSFRDDCLHKLPDLADTSIMVFQVHNAVTALFHALNVVDAVDAVDAVEGIDIDPISNRLSSILKNKHGWDGKQFVGHVNILELTQDIDTLMGLLYVF
jgi:hypothetical protein